jgi:hypothetical protein
MFTIKIVERATGKPAKSQRVSAGFNGFGRGMTKDQWTDQNGEAHFDHDPGKGEIYINGKNSYEGQIEGRVLIYI